MKFLVVDDSSTMRRIITNSLNSAGYGEVVEAGDGNEGISALEQNPDVNIILTDWNMPNMDGLTFLTKVREKNKEIPIIMVTTEAEKQNVVTAIKAGANNYIVKPFTPDILKEKIAPFIK